LRNKNKLKINFNNVLNLPEYSSSSPLIKAPQGPIAVIDAD